MCLPNNDSKFKSNGYFSVFTYLIWQSLKILIIFFLKTPNFLATVCPILFSSPLLIKQDIYPPVFFFLIFTFIQFDRIWVSWSGKGSLSYANIGQVHKHHSRTNDLLFCLSKNSLPLMCRAGHWRRSDSVPSRNSRPS